MSDLQEATIQVQECSDMGWGFKIKASGKTWNLPKTVKATGASSSAFLALGEQPPVVGQVYTVKYAEVPYSHQGKSGMSKYIRLLAKGGNMPAQASSADDQRLSRIETRLAFLEGKLGVTNMPRIDENGQEHNPVSIDDITF